MKSTVTTFLALFLTAAFSVSATAAPSKSQALTECKAHLADLYQNEARTKVKRIKKRGGDLEVKLKVTAEGERFNAVCAFADGNMTYSSDLSASTIAD